VPFYVRDKSLVTVCRTKHKATDDRVTWVPAIVPLQPAAMARALGQNATWQRQGKKAPIAIDPPREVVEQIMAMVSEWPFPPLTGVVSTPAMRSDGSLLIKPGYDPVTGYVLFDPPAMPPIPDRPTRDEAMAALGILKELLAEFPFKNDESRSVALSMQITPVVRSALGAVPMHAISAPAPGTGKSYLMDIAAMIAFGDLCPVFSMASKDETEKRLIGAALAQQPIVAIDNISELLASDFLCQLTERQVLQPRGLGKSDMPKLRNSSTVFGNGNNLRVAADQVRRTLFGRLDANMENPEQREFKGNPISSIAADRGKYIAAILTAVRAYIVRGRPGKLPSYPSYEAWSDNVRSALVWLGEADPLSTIAALRTEDPVRVARAAVFNAWAEELDIGIGYQTGELVKCANQYTRDEPTNPALREALLTVAKPRSGQPTIDPTILGQWLRRNLDNIAAGYRLDVDRSDAARPKWKIEREAG
jgi:hypothetical protein